MRLPDLAGSTRDNMCALSQQRQLQCMQRSSASLRSGLHCRKLVLQRGRPQCTTVHAASTLQATVESFLPMQLAGIEEPAAQRLAARMQREPINVESLGRAVNTAFVPPAQQASGPGSGPPLLLLHAFDSSSLEYRRLHPLLEQDAETWLVDVLGCGFTDSSMWAAEPERLLTPALRREHLYSFWRQKINRPVALVGCSLGGAVAIDFAVHHPDAVECIVLADAQGFIDGLGAMSTLPRPLAVAGVWLLGTEQLRNAANVMAYTNKKEYATVDALRIGRLHTFMPGWLEANVAFMRGGGYSLSKRIPEVQQPALVLWGRNDEILDPAYAERFEKTLPNARLQWIEEAGHMISLEKPRETANAILSFVKATQQPQ